MLNATCLLPKNVQEKFLLSLYYQMSTPEKQHTHVSLLLTEESVGGNLVESLNHRFTESWNHRIVLVERDF